MKVPKRKLTDLSADLKGRDVQLYEGDIKLNDVKDCKVHFRETNSDKYKS